MQASELQALVDAGDGEGAMIKLQNELAQLRTQANDTLPKCVAPALGSQCCVQINPFFASSIKHCSGIAGQICRHALIEKLQVSLLPALCCNMFNQTMSSAQSKLHTHTEARHIWHHVASRALEERRRQLAQLRDVLSGSVDGEAALARLRGAEGRLRADITAAQVLHHSLFSFKACIASAAAAMAEPRWRASAARRAACAPMSSPRGWFTIPLSFIMMHQLCLVWPGRTMAHAKLTWCLCSLVLISHHVSFGSVACAKTKRASKQASTAKRACWHRQYTPVTSVRHFTNCRIALQALVAPRRQQLASRCMTQSQ